MDISEVVRRSGLPASTLRFYEQKGLIASVGRRGLHRVFAAGVLEQLSLIALGRAAGFSLNEIAAMFGADGRPRIERQQLLEKADELDQSIKQLTAMRDGLARGGLFRAQPSGVPQVPSFDGAGGCRGDRMAVAAEAPA